MIESEENGRELTSLVVLRDGRLVSTGESAEPYRMLDAEGEAVEPVARTPDMGPCLGGSSVR